MLLGISLGVICNIVFPSWFIILEFMNLGYITRRSFISGVLRWKTKTFLAIEEKERLTLSIDTQEHGQLLVEPKASSYNVHIGKFVKFFYLKENLDLEAKKF